MDSLAGDLQETLKVQPNTPGRNVALVGIFDTRRPSLGPVTGVDVTTTSADGATMTTVHAVALSDGQVSANLDLERPGATPLSVVVHRAGLPRPPVVHSYDWVVGNPTGQLRPVTVSQAPIGGALRRLAGYLALAIVIAAAGALSLRSRGRKKASALRPTSPAPPIAHRDGAEAARDDAQTGGLLVQ